MSIEKPNVRPRSHLFTVRVWEEEIGADQTEWRGKVQVFPSAAGARAPTKSDVRTALW